jgi:hypothetical protein
VEERSDYWGNMFKWVIEKSVDINASIDTVWKALLNPQ